MRVCPWRRPSRASCPRRRATRSVGTGRRPPRPCATGSPFPPSSRSIPAFSEGEAAEISTGPRASWLRRAALWPHAEGPRTKAMRTGRWSRTRPWIASSAGSAAPLPRGRATSTSSPRERGRGSASASGRGSWSETASTAASSPGSWPRRSAPSTATRRSVTFPRTESSSSPSTARNSRCAWPSLPGSEERPWSCASHRARPPGSSTCRSSPRTRPWPSAWPRSPIAPTDSW